MQGRSHLLPFDNETGVCALQSPAASVVSCARVIPAIAESRALRAEVTYEDPTGSFSTGGGATPAGHGPSPANGLDWSDDADTNVLQPRHLPRSLITDSELEWDERDEGSTELWNGPGELLRGERRAAARGNAARQPASANGAKGTALNGALNGNGATNAQRGPRLPEPSISPKQARGMQPTAAEPARGALKGTAPQAGAPNRQRHGTLPPAQLGAAQGSPAPERTRRGTLPPPQLGTSQAHPQPPQAQPASNGQRRGTLPPAQLGASQVHAPNGQARAVTPQAQPAPNGQRRGTLPPAQLGATQAGAAPNGQAAPAHSTNTAATNKLAATGQHAAPRTQPSLRRSTPVPAVPTATVTPAEAVAELLQGLDPAVAALDPRRQATLVMHAPPRPQMPPARPASVPAPRLQLPAAAPDDEEDALEHVQEQLFEAMARARAEQARAERAELRAQQAEARLEGLDTRAQRAEAELSSSAERVQRAEVQAQRAEGRARSGESRAQQAELRLRQLDTHLLQLESHVHQLRARMQQAEELAQGASERIQEAEGRAQQATAHLHEIETLAHEAAERAQEAEERAQEAEEQLENLALAQASSAQPLHQEDAHSGPAFSQLREQVAVAYEHIRVTELRADEAERRAQAAEQAARLAQSTLHLSDEVEHSLSKKPSKVSLVQSALLASTLSFGVGAYFALFVPLQQRVQTEAELRTHEAAQHSQAVSTLQAQRDAERRGLESQNQELRSQLEAARVASLVTGEGSVNERHSRRDRGRAADADSSEPEAVPGTRSAKAIERRMRRQHARSAQSDAADSSASDKPAARAAAPKRSGGSDPLDGL